MTAPNRLLRVLPTRGELFPPEASVSPWERDDRTHDAVASTDASPESSIVGTIRPSSSVDFRLLDESEIERLPSLTWVLDRILPEGAFAVLYGQPGGGKSFVGLDWALSIASGTDWCGHQTQRGPVVYVWAEGKTGIKERLHAWKQARNLQSVPLFRVFPRALQLLESREVDGFVECLRGQLPEDPKLIIIDTLARCFVGGDENSAKDRRRGISGGHGWAVGPMTSSPNTSPHSSKPLLLVSTVLACS
jgi:predicted ATP-dependent serine protease